MITTISAFRVYSTPMVALKEMNVLTSMPDTAASAPPAANASAEYLPHVDADQAGSDRIDGDGAQGRAEAGVAQHQEQGESHRAGAEEGEQPIQRDCRAEHVHGRRQEAVAAQIAAPVHQRQALEHEEQAEGDEHDVGVERVLVRRAADQRDHQVLVDQPVDREGDRHADEQAQQRIELPQHDREEGGERAAHEELAVGEIQNARHAVLQVQAERDQPVHPAEEQAVEEDFEQDHASPPGNKRTGQAELLRPDPVFNRPSLVRHDHAGFGN